MRGDRAQVGEQASCNSGIFESGESRSQVRNFPQKQSPNRASGRPPDERWLVRALLDWFGTNARDLPWRRTSDPYAIWISEIMLQQTQVGTVIPYWERWLRALPDIATLAAASPEKVLKLWEGLGYYSRARNLQAAAQEIVARHGGKFPREFAAILELPGIGRYTAGAISSIAFHQPAPILDGNVIRVLTRLFGIRENPREKQTNEKLWELAQQLVILASEAGQGGTACSHLNQSLMELGALVCTPRQPQCPLCPLRAQCAALREGIVDQLPNLGKRAAATPRFVTAFVVERTGKFLVRQRPVNVVNARLWEFPNVETPRRLRTRPHKLAAELGCALTAREPLCVIKHSITRYRIELSVWSARSTSSANGTPGSWRSVSQMGELAFTSAHGKIARLLERNSAAG